MRIIAGNDKGRRFYPPKHLPVRPTTDLAKEALFNIIQNNFIIENLKILDLFTGTGSISYEFASRGAIDITCVDRDDGCIKFVKQTAALLNYEGIKPIKSDVLKFIDHCTEKYDIIFAGPPYSLKNIPGIISRIFEKELLHAKGWLILEHDDKLSLDDLPHLLYKRNYGTTIFSIFEKRNA